MAELRDSETAGNLIEAFAAEARASLRYLFFAQQADIEGFPAAAALFRAVADGESGHALGHLDYLVEVGDPDSAAPMGTTADHLRAALESETVEGVERYPAFAATARAEGFTEIAEWFDGLAEAETAYAERFRSALGELDEA